MLRLPVTFPGAMIESVGKMADEAALIFKTGEFDEESVKDAPPGGESGKAHRPTVGLTLLF